MSNISTNDKMNYILSFRWIWGYFAFYFLGRQAARLREQPLSPFIFFALALMFILALHFKTTGTLASPYIRLQGYYQNPNHLALGIVLVWAYILGFSVLESSGRKRQILNLLVLLVATVALISTYSRSAWMGALAALAFSLFYSKSKKLWYASTAAILFLTIAVKFNLFGLYKRLIYSFNMAPTGAQSSRFTVWEVSWNIFLDNPILGVGLENSSRLYSEYYERLGFSGSSIVGHSHNQFLDIISGAGVLGLTFYLAIFFSAFKFLHSAFSSHQNVLGQKLALGGQLAIIALMVSSLTDSPFRLHEVRNFLLILLGFTVGYLKLEPRVS
jgi:O-antigen ligase